jgi:hypothetical protein
MRAAGQPDAFVVTNGPEDGAEHTIVRAPCHAGSDETCNVLLRLDKSVARHHALITVVSQGYRVRRLGSASVRVDGKRAGMLRSRIVRNGGTISIGHTHLALDCAPDGLAHRSQGIVAESDFGWVAQQAGRYAVHGIRRAIRFAISLFGRIVSSWLAIFAVLFLIYTLVPPVRYFVNDIFAWIGYQLRYLIDTVRYG